MRTRLSALRAALKRSSAAAAAREAQNATADFGREPAVALGPRGYRLREKRAAVGALAEAVLQGK